MRDFWDELSVDERYGLLSQVYDSALSKISGYEYLPLPSQVCHCDWDNIGPIYQDALMGCISLTS